ncbi:testis-expressed basic protein 1 isoform X3 [Mesocricetus auratus]|uniref:Testis-expressed basic protein 1 isoform X3 n=1 Tax=Mesocricetus auratus TaxID=10036 RepID=A0ABM2WBA8_MESAU|nr:testis-expressed basic protein 1 isoform X3 [Mesocricetus auratus]
MAVLEVILAVILSLLGLAILAILIARWTRRRQNAVQVSRYASEQSAGLLDYEDGVCCTKQKKVKGEVAKGVLTPSAICLGIPSATSLRVQSANSLGPCRSNPVVNQDSACRTKNGKSTREPMSANSGHISGTIGPIMQFSAPIPGATGPIKLSQRTIVQTPGPIVQFTGSSSEPSEACCPAVESNCGMPSQAISGPNPVSFSGSQAAMVHNCPSSTPILRPGPSMIQRQDQGCIDGGGPQTTDSRAQMVKHGGTMCPDGSRESIRRKMVFGSKESYTALQKKDARRNRGRRDKCELVVPRRLESLCRHSSEMLEFEVCHPKRRDPHLINQIGAARRQECQPTRHDQGLPKRQESQVRFDTGCEPVAEAIWCDPPPVVCKRRDSPRRNDEGILKRPESSTRRPEDCPPAPQEYQERGSTREKKYSEAPPPASAEPPPPDM